MGHLCSSLSLQLGHPVLEQGRMRRRAAAALQAAGHVHPGLRSVVSAVVAAYWGYEVDRVLQGICKRGQQRCYILPCHIPEVALQGVMRFTGYPDQAGVTYCARYSPKQHLTQCTDLQHTLMLLYQGPEDSSAYKHLRVVCIVAYRKGSHLHDKPEGRCLWWARYEPWNDIRCRWACSLLLPVLSRLSAPFLIILVLDIGCGLCECQGQASSLFGQLCKTLRCSAESTLVRFQGALKAFRLICGGLGGHRMAW